MASRFKNMTVDIGMDYVANVVAYANGSATSPLNLTNYITANGHVKKTFYPGSSAAIFNVWVQDATAGIINLHLNRANTTTLSPGNYVYDVAVTSPYGIRTRVVEGIITATAGVSK